MVSNKVNKSYLHAFIPPPPQPHAIADTGATGHYIAPDDIISCTNITPTIHDPTVLAANGHRMKSTHNLTVPLAPTLSSQAQQGHLLPNVNTGFLISISKFRDDDCMTTFSKKDVIITKNDKLIIHGNHSKVDGLWHIPPEIHPSTLHTSST